MHRLFRYFLILPMLLGALVHAQSAGTITFTANQTSAQGSLVPVLTWATTPVASICVGSGSWSGNKFASGSETLPAITSSKSYTLTCSWNSGVANLTWTAPTQNTDNSALTDLAGFKVLYGTSTSTLSQQQVVGSAAARGAMIPALAAGTWYFAVRAVNSKQLESDNSNVAQRTIAGVSAVQTVAITITGTPPPPPPTATLKTMATSVYDIVWRSGVRNLGRVVGTIPIGKPCQSTIKVGTNYYKVNKADVAITIQPRSTNVIAQCALS